MPRHGKPKVNKSGRISAGILLWRPRHLHLMAPIPTVTVESPSTNGNKRM